MKISIILLGYLRWHYGKAVRSLSRVWKIFLGFIFDFFSIKLIFENFFDPWKRMIDTYPKSFDWKKYFTTFMTNLIVRVVGVIMRTVLILIGLACYILFAILYPFAILVWLLLPIIIIILFWVGLSLIIK